MLTETPMPTDELGDADETSKLLLPVSVPALAAGVLEIAISATDAIAAHLSLLITLPWAHCVDIFKNLFPEMVTVSRGSLALCSRPCNLNPFIDTKGVHFRSGTLCGLSKSLVFGASLSQALSNYLVSVLAETAKAKVFEQDGECAVGRDSIAP